MQLWENWSSHCYSQNVVSSIRKLWNRQHLLEDSQSLWLVRPWKTAISRPHFDIGFWLFSKMTCCLNHKLEYESIEKFRGENLIYLDSINWIHRKMFYNTRYRTYSIELLTLVTIWIELTCYNVFFEWHRIARCFPFHKRVIVWNFFLSFLHFIKYYTNLNKTGVLGFWGFESWPTV